MKEPLDEIERVFSAFGDKTRLRLLTLMQPGEVSVNYLCETLKISQPKVSRHLAYLRAMGVVNTRRDGKWIYYSLAEPKSDLGSRLFRDALNWVAVIVNPNSEEPAAQNVPSAVSLNDRSHNAAHNTYAQADISSDRDELEIYLL